MIALWQAELSPHVMLQVALLWQSIVKDLQALDPVQLILQTSSLEQVTVEN